MKKLKRLRYSLAATLLLAVCAMDAAHAVATFDEVKIGRAHV